MFGQASNHWLSPTALLLMVAFFTMQLSSGLASNVHDMSLDLDNFARIHLSQTDGSLGDDGGSKCLIQYENESNACEKEAQEGEFHEITDKDCKNSFAHVKCITETFCHRCKEHKFEDYSKILKDELDKEAEKCKQWNNLTPKLPTSCADNPDGHNGTGGHNGTDDHHDGPKDHSPEPGGLSTTTIIIIVVVGAVVVIAGGVIAWCMCSSGDGGGGGRKNKGKSTKSKSKSRKSGKSLKAKSRKSRKSGKSLKAKSKKSKSAKSLKAKSTKSKGGKSMKAKSAKG